MRRISGVLVVLAGGLVAVPSVTEADKPAPDVSIRAIPSPSGITATKGVRVIAGYGFEAGEGFAAGWISGQAGWGTMAANTTQPAVSAANPATGTQHLRLGDDPAVASGSSSAAFSPNLGAQSATDQSEVTINVAISATGGADYDIIGQAPSESLLTWRVKFHYLGGIRVADDTGAGLAYVDTGTVWNAGPSYTQLRVVTDPVANTIDYYYGGALIYSSVAGVFGGHNVEQVVILDDQWQFGETGDFDDLNINTAYPVELLSLHIE